jgi:formate dehydrogenase major subunit
MTQTAEKATWSFPEQEPRPAERTLHNTEKAAAGRKAVNEDVLFSNWEIAAELAHVFEADMPYDDISDISAEMDEQVYKYKHAEIGEVFGGVLAPEKAVLQAVGDAKFVDPLDSTDNLMNVISQRLPRPA